MAVRINVNGSEYGRGDIFFVDPNEILVKEELRGRVKAPDADKIIAMAESMLEHGQRQAAEVRKYDDHKLQLTLGFTRTAAARLIREGFTGLDGVHKQDAEFRLKVMIADVDERTAVINNIVENAHRNECTVIDDAHNHARLRDKYGMSDDEVARLYKCSKAKIAYAKKFLMLDQSTQDAIHAGSISPEAGLLLLEVPQEERAPIVAKHANGNGKVATANVRHEVRDRILRDDDKPVSEPRATVVSPAESSTSSEAAPAPAAKQAPSMTLKELREFFAIMGSSRANSDAMKAFGAAMLDAINGKASIRTAQKMLEKAFAESATV